MKIELVRNKEDSDMIEMYTRDVKGTTTKILIAVAHQDCFGIKLNKAIADAEEYTGESVIVAMELV